MLKKKETSSDAGAVSLFLSLPPLIVRGAKIIKALVNK